MKPEPKHSKSEVNGIDPDNLLTGKLTHSSSPLMRQIRIYAIMAAGLFLFLFSVGYFQILKSVLGGLGIALMAWGAVTSGLLQLLVSGLEKALSYFNKK